jgi:hypothetical protein
MGPRWASLWPSWLPSRSVFRERVVNELFTVKLSREQETDADPGKIDPSGMITCLERLSTHPMSAARAKQLKADLAALPKKSLDLFDL